MVLVYADEYRKTNRLNTEFSSDLDSLCRRDYGHAFFNKEIPCLDIDEFERSCTGQNECTMDAAIGIGTYDQNTVKDQRFLLVELRLGYTNANNLDYQNMSQKIDHTKDILSGSRIHPNYFFIFTPNVSSVAKNCFSRKMRQLINIASWKAMSPQDFLNAIEHRENLPYTPINDINDISNNFENAFSKGESPFIDFYSYWIDRVDEYRYQYNFAEASSILKALKNTLGGLTTTDKQMLGYIQLMEEEIDRKLSNIG